MRLLDYQFNVYAEINAKIFITSLMCEAHMMIMTDRVICDFYQVDLASGRVAKCNLKTR